MESWVQEYRSFWEAVQSSLGNSRAWGARCRQGQITRDLECQAKEIIYEMYPAQCWHSKYSMLVFSCFLFSGVPRLMGSLETMMRVAEDTKVINIQSVCDPNISQVYMLTMWCVAYRDSGVILSSPGSACRGCHNWGRLQQLQCPRGEACVWRVQRWPLLQLQGSLLRRSLPTLGHMLLA